MLPIGNVPEADAIQIKDEPRQTVLFGGRAPGGFYNRASSALMAERCIETRRMIALCRLDSGKRKRMPMPSNASPHRNHQGNRRRNSSIPSPPLAAGKPRRRVNSFSLELGNG